MPLNFTMQLSIQERELWIQLRARDIFDEGAPRRDHRRGGGLPQDDERHPRGAGARRRPHRAAGDGLRLHDVGGRLCAGGAEEEGAGAARRDEALQEEEGGGGDERDRRLPEGVRQALAGGQVTI